MTDFKRVLMGAVALICIGAAIAVIENNTSKTKTVTAMPRTVAARTAGNAVATEKAREKATTRTAAATDAVEKTTSSARSTAAKTTPLAPKPVAPPAPPPAFTGLQYVTQASVGLEDARRIALKAHPGKVTNSALGPDRAGKTLRYVFTIDGSYVYVDANDGKILAKDP